MMDDPDRMQDEQREDAVWEQRMLQRHLDGGLAGDVEVEDRIRKLGSSEGSDR